MISKEHDELKYAELEVRSLTGARRALSHDIGGPEG